MTLAQSLVSPATAPLALGALLTILNGRILIRERLGKRSPSVVPLLGGILLFIGALSFPGGVLRPWAVLGLFLDYGCMPYLIFGSFRIIQETRRYAPRNRLLSLEYTNDQGSGQFHLYPNRECLHRWQTHDGRSSGSMIMEVAEYLPGQVITLTLQESLLTLKHDGEAWQLEHEQGWHAQAPVQAGSRLTEIVR